MATHGLEAAFRRIRDAAARHHLLDIREGSSYGTPALLMRGKMFVRVMDADTIVLRCNIEDKEHLVAAAPEVFFETDHYKGWPLVLARLSAMDDEELGSRIAQALRARRAG